MTTILAGTVALLLVSPGTNDLEGRWNVQAQASFSTCEGTAIGDSRTEQWNFSGSGSSLTVAITDQESGNTELYAGAVRSDGSIELRAHEKQVKLKVIGKALVGRRVHMTTNPKRKSCTILYDLRASRG